MTQEQIKQIEQIAKQIKKILGPGFTGSVEFHMSGMQDIKFTIKICGCSK